MLSSIFNSNIGRLAALLAVILTVAAGLEKYCRTSAAFSQNAYTFLQHVATTDPTNAVFGDSHVEVVPRIPGFSFYGWGGEQPEELETLVKYFYASTQPKKVIIQADPQWFGEYHRTRQKFLIPENLINRSFPSVVTSKYYRMTLKRNLVNSVEAIFFELLSVAAASAGEAAATISPEEHWLELYTKNPDFNWSWMPESERLFLTELRVQAQNPRADFQTSDAAHAFEAALSILADKGADVCLFRTPVTRLYLEQASTMPASRYREFDIYIEALANRFLFKHVDFRSLATNTDDSSFTNADHLTDREQSKLWPLVYNACFGGSSPYAARQKMG